MKAYFTYPSEIGAVAIAEEGGRITALTLAKTFCSKGYEKKETALTKKAAGQFKDYLEGKLKKFDLPLAPKGTAFQQKVWQALIKIPYGKTKTYGDIARDIKKPKACRAVGGANNKNPIFIVIPCHRVVGCGGLTGYAFGLGLKKRLLDMEAKTR
jgi:methylated-DNA-[protein]-cysteine S-methyltransferase